MATKILRWAVTAVTAGMAVPTACAPSDGEPDSLRSAPESVSAAPLQPTIVFLGTSLTAGYGLTTDQAYPALVQAKVDSAGLDYRVVNAGVNGATSAEGVTRIDWLLRQPLGVLVLELGANDGLRGRDIAMMRQNLQTIIDQTRAAYPDATIVIAGMEAPPNLGRPYTMQFRRAFRELAEANEAVLIPFLLEDVAGIPRLNQPDGIHPNADGQRIVAENVWQVLRPALR